MTGSDIEAASLESAKAIITANRLEKSIRLTQQTNKTHIFKGILKEQDRYHFTMCNPPFHASAKDAAAGTQRKLNNLRKSSTINPPKESKTQLNFGGQHNELWCDGGELQFIKRMIAESTDHKDQCLWFTTLVSKKENLPSIQRTLKKHKVSYFKEVKMAQGSKVSRFIAWTFQSQSDYPAWFS
jgi:23S rRNA (adenine1618-N6)-methyltransferase